MTNDIRRQVGKLSTWWRLGELLRAEIFDVPFFDVEGLNRATHVGLRTVINTAHVLSKEDMELVRSVKAILPDWYVDALVIYTLPRWDKAHPAPDKHLEAPWLTIYTAILDAFWTYHSALQFHPHPYTLNPQLTPMLDCCFFLRCGRSPIGVYYALEHVAALAGKERDDLLPQGLDLNARVFTWCRCDNSQNEAASRVLATAGLSYDRARNDPNVLP